MIFGEILAKDLRDPQLNEGALLQCVDNNLFSYKTKGTSDQNTVLTLNFLVERGYEVFNKKDKFLSLLLNIWV